MREVHLPESWRFRIRSWESSFSRMQIIGRDDDTGGLCSITFAGVTRARLSTGWRGIRLHEAPLESLPEAWKPDSLHASSDYLYKVTAQPDTGDHGYILGGFASIHTSPQGDAAFEELAAGEMFREQVGINNLFR